MSAGYRLKKNTGSHRARVGVPMPRSTTVTDKIRGGDRLRNIASGLELKLLANASRLVEVPSGVIHGNTNMQKIFAAAAVLRQIAAEQADFYSCGSIKLAQVEENAINKAIRCISSSSALVVYYNFLTEQNSSEPTIVLST